MKDVSMGPYTVLATGAPSTTTWKMKSQVHRHYEKLTVSPNRSIRYVRGLEMKTELGGWGGRTLKARIQIQIF